MPTIIESFNRPLLPYIKIITNVQMQKVQLKKYVNDIAIIQWMTKFTSVRRLKAVGNCAR